MPGLTRIPLTIPRGGFESFVNAWFLEDKKRGRVSLMETGPASAVPNLVSDLKKLGVEHLDYLLFTHIHLDHAGGAGQFHKLFPDAKIIVPQKGRRHLVDPSKLIAGSKTSLGSLSDIYGVPEPVPETALAPEGFSMNGLEIIDTPGHSPHHSSYVYELDGHRLLFAGEAAGCCFELPDACVFIRPASPRRFFYDSAMSSINKLLSLMDIDLICYPHSGSFANWHELVKNARTQMVLWHDIISALPAGAPLDDVVRTVMESDPVMHLIDNMPENDRKREQFFIRQSVNGFIGYCDEERSKHA